MRIAAEPEAAPLVANDRATCSPSRRFGCFHDRSSRRTESTRRAGYLAFVKVQVLERHIHVMKKEYT